MAGAFAVVNLVVASPAPSARAQEDVPVAVAVRARENRRSWADGLRRATLDEYRARGREVVEPPLPSPVPTDREALEEAGAAYAHLRPAEALRLVDGVIGGFEATGGASLDREGYLRALLLRALAALALGLGAEADRALSTALAVDASLTPNAAEYPPALLERLDALRALSGAETGILLLEVAPASAEVWVDGAHLGSSEPRLVLAPGRHVLRFEAPLRSAQARVIAIESGVSAPLSVRLEPSAHAALGGPSPESAPEALLAEAAHGLGASLVLVDVRETADGLLVHAREAARRRAARVSVRPGEAAASVARRLVGLLLAPAVARDEEGARRRRRVRIGASVGASAVAAGVAATLAGVFARDRGAGGFEGQWSRDAAP